MKGVTINYVHLLDNYRKFFIFKYFLILAFIYFGPW